MKDVTTRAAMGMFALAVFAALSMLPMATVHAADDAAQLKTDVEELKKQVKEAKEWRSAESKVHLAGYGTATYTKVEDEDGGFTQAQFSPIFHYLFNDLVMLEAELEFSATSEGETETALEYVATDIFINDYMMLVAGKFLSPLGQFRQNLHPSWINKLPSHPPGFGEEEGAAPVSEVGAELRGGFHLGKQATANYAVYIGNGPALEAESGELAAVESEGRTSNPDGKMVVGGRFGILPIPKLEIGVSAAAGKTSVTSDGGVEVVGDPTRDYTVAGADFVWHFRNLEWRGEYVQQEVGSAAGSVAPEEAKWRSWYTQAAYKFFRQKWEAVVRYTDFNSPETALDQKQWAFGINYLFANNLIAKLDFESNDGEAGAPADANRIQAQIAYGF